MREEEAAGKEEDPSNEVVEEVEVQVDPPTGAVEEVVVDLPEEVVVEVLVEANEVFSVQVQDHLDSKESDRVVLGLKVDLQCSNEPGHKLDLQHSKEPVPAFLAPKWIEARDPQDLKLTIVRAQEVKFSSL